MTREDELELESCQSSSDSSFRESVGNSLQLLDVHDIPVARSIISPTNRARKFSVAPPAMKGKTFDSELLLCLTFWGVWWAIAVFLGYLKLTVVETDVAT